MYVQVPAITDNNVTYADLYSMKLQFLEYHSEDHWTSLTVISENLLLSSDLVIISLLAILFLSHIQ